MADAYEPYHVQQQSRRDKLCILSQSQNPSLDSQFHFHPPLSTSVFPVVDADFLSFHTDSDAVKPSEPQVPGNFMGFLGGSPSTSSAHRACDQSFNGGEILVFNPEPLSLSLSSHPHNNLHRFGHELVAPGGGSAASRSSGPLGPFTGYASILKGSRFLKPAQQLLEEFCNVGHGIHTNRNDNADSLSMFNTTVENLAGTCGGGDSGKKKSMLISMLDEVYKKYKQYYEQLEAVVASFECVAGLRNAAPYAALALKTLSRHFWCLKNVIAEQLQFTNENKQHVHAMNSEKIESLRFGNEDGRGFCSSHQSSFSDLHPSPPVWRPHRGLPERAVTVLRAWLFDHFLHPYPTDTDKLMLAKQTGLSRNQVSNWFINARVRLWKPMVEEIHMLETRQAQKSSSLSATANFCNDVFPENPSSSAQRLQYSPPKKSRNNDVSGDLPAARNDASGFSFGGHDLMGVGSSNVPVLSTNGVSLTLGLHQNNGVGLPEPFPMNAAQRFGLGGGDGYVRIAGGGGVGLEGQNRQFGRNFIGNNNQLLHDFVG